MTTPRAIAPTNPCPRVLFSFASRHGATREIAAVARSFRRTRRLAVVLAPVGVSPDPVNFDAVVLGSAVYGARWPEPASRYVGVVAHELRSRPTWLISSGLVCDEPRFPEAADDGRWIGDSIKGRDHRMLHGRVERRVLSPVERQIWGNEPAVTGDFREWAAVRAWSEDIAEHLILCEAVRVPR